MESAQNMESHQSEVEELRAELTTVTEALILFQEFLETEIGEMAYFRESGSHNKLVETLNKLRAKESTANPLNLKIRQSLMEPRVQHDFNEEEQVEVDVDYTDDDPVDEITIRKVFKKDPVVETLFKRNNSAITITPVFSHEKKAEHAPFFLPPSGPILVDNSVPPQLQLKIASADASLFHQVSPITFVQQQAKENGKTGVNNSENNDFGSMGSFAPPNYSYFSTALIPPPPVMSESTGAKHSLNRKQKKMSVFLMNNPMKKRGRKGAPKKPQAVGIRKRENEIKNNDKPLNLKKKGRRPRTECPVRCEICGKGYSSKGVMSRHIKEAHKSEPQFPCFYCNVKFRTGPTRLEHMNAFHPSEMNNDTCPYCKRRSSTVAGKRNHMMLCARKYQAMIPGQLPQSSSSTPTKATTTSPTDSGVEMDVASPSG